MLNKVRCFWEGDDGAIATEYGLIAGLISLLVITGSVSIQTELVRIFQSIISFFAAIVVP